MLKFSDKEIVGHVTVTAPVSANDIETIMVNGMEGGIGYWAMLDNSGEQWNEKPKDIPLSQWATKLLIDGKPVRFMDRETGQYLPYLTLSRLLQGYTQNIHERSWDADLENGDATTADCIIQYAIFGKLVFG